MRGNRFKCHRKSIPRVCSQNRQIHKQTRAIAPAFVYHSTQYVNKCGQMFLLLFTKTHKMGTNTGKHSRFCFPLNPKRKQTQAKRNKNRKKKQKQPNQPRSHFHIKNIDSAINHQNKIVDSAKIC